MPNVEDFVLKVESICGGEVNSVVVLRPEKIDKAITRILSRCTVKKRVADYMWEVNFLKVTFRVFKNGRIVFRGTEKDELNNLLAKLFT
ncbi:MAG: hypothetical protein ACQCN3_05375 [Candidatus Bathyarchaeia archaeon]|jgi:hypothetical protein